jgi:hypothetical protein
MVKNTFQHQKLHNVILNLIISLFIRLNNFSNESSGFKFQRTRNQSPMSHLFWCPVWLYLEHVTGLLYLLLRCLVLRAFGTAYRVYTSLLLPTTKYQDNDISHNNSIATNYQQPNTNIKQLSEENAEG